MRIMSSHAIVLSLIAFLLRTAICIVCILRICFAVTCGGVRILATELLPAFPAPGFAASGSYHEGAPRRETARKDVVTRRVLEAPSFTPWTLFSIVRHSSCLIPIYFSLDPHSDFAFAFVAALNARKAWKA